MVFFSLISSWFDVYGTYWKVGDRDLNTLYLGQGPIYWDLCRRSCFLPHGFVTNNRSKF